MNDPSILNPPTLLGVPVALCGAIFLFITAIYALIWPRPEVGTPPRPGWAHIVLRWFHPAVWLLWAGASFLLADGREAPAAVVAVLGGLVYLAFLLTLLADRRR
ncbi:MAG: hypothetical protein ACRDHL_06745 [Candidatus Promineifilaceae bacterium]